MSPMSPVMGFSYTQGEWIVLRGGFHSPAIFGGEKKNHELEKSRQTLL